MVTQNVDCRTLPLQNIQKMHLIRRNHRLKKNQWMEVNEKTNIFTLDTNERNRELERDLTERNLIESIY